MELFTQEIIETMKANHEAQQVKDVSMMVKPVVKIFGGSITYLLSEYDDATGEMYGLCDLGMGFPEIGPVLRSDLESALIGGMFPLERDSFWKPEKTVCEYADEARQLGYIA